VSAAWIWAFQLLKPRLIARGKQFGLNFSSFAQGLIEAPRTPIKDVIDTLIGFT
jgi:hypothetical protein